jgi:hypothetical protein
MLFSLSVYSQNTNYKEYSYTEFFELIEQETDTVFKLKDALSKYNPETDQRFSFTNDVNFVRSRDSTYISQNDIVIDKHLELENVQFASNVDVSNGFRFLEGVLFDIHFKKPVSLSNTLDLDIRYCRFDDTFRLNTTSCEIQNIIEDKNNIGTTIFYSEFTGKTKKERKTDQQIRTQTCCGTFSGKK